MDLRPADPDHAVLLLAIVLLPAIGAVLNGLFGRHLGKQGVTVLGVGTVATAFVLSVLTFLQLGALGDEGGAALRYTAYTWFRLTPRLDLSVAFLADPLSAVMLLVVTGVGSLIHLYSTEYMHGEDDAGYARYFAYLNLFTFSMLVLVLGDSLPLLFVGWEGVGLCSYLLIGFWFTDEAKASAGKKAFLVNRVGDFGFLLGMIVLFNGTNALSFEGLEAGREALVTSSFAGLPFAAATVACLCLLLGATGKSAQIPLYVWLPDAMAGPTPVSALIHAATMVTAGVYMIARLGFLFVLSPPALALVAMVGALTAVFAATIALVQNDIKKVLAYSTVSQLGYMFIGVGVGAFGAGVFHLVTHAFFKACLFLGAGAVIHALGGEQDIRKMGGLAQAKGLRGTRLTFLASTLAIMGFPLTSGFFSKDEILWKAYATANPWAPWLPYVVYTLGLAGAVMTAFYMARLYLLTFEGSHRGDPHALHHLHAPGPAMEWPLFLLAALAIVGGAVGVPHMNALEHWLHPVLALAERAATMRIHSFGVELAFMAVSVVAMAVGAGLAFSWYLRADGKPAAALAASTPGLYRMLDAKWRIDELYDRVVVRPLAATAQFAFAFFDRKVIDGAMVHGTAHVVMVVGDLLRRIQTGVVQTYAFFMVVGLAATLWLLTSPYAHFRGEIRDGRLHLHASKGPGYEYRWDADGDGRWDTDAYSRRNEIVRPLATPKQGSKRVAHRVRLEVKSPWGTAEVERTVR